MYLHIGKESVFTYWKRQSSLGEIHSISLCIITGCGVFLSDDNDSQYLANIIKNQFMQEISVYSRSDIADKMKEQGLLNSNKRKVFAHKK